MGGNRAASKMWDNAGSPRLPLVSQEEPKLQGCGSLQQGWLSWLKGDAKSKPRSWVCVWKREGKARAMRKMCVVKKILLLVVGFWTELWTQTVEGKSKVKDTCGRNMTA